MPDICEGGHDYEADDEYRPRGPEDREAEGPWFHMTSEQVRKLAEFVGGHQHGVRVEYRGAGYWEAELEGADGQGTGERRLIVAL
jgi:hypothetical protein